MRNMIRTGCIVFLLTCIFSVATQAQSTKYKCMLQMTNYMGEGAYIVVSIINKDNGYAKTLYVLGSDRKWYKTLKEWDKAFKKKPADISAVTGASVSGGDRSMFTLDIENAKINSGYKLRFESAVEDKTYYVSDLEIPLTTESLAAKNEGKGYIRYVRFSAN